MRHTLLLVCLLSSQPASAAPKWLKVTATAAAHVSLGFGSYEAFSHAAGGGPRTRAIGLVGAGTVAGLKEYADYTSGKDSAKKAIKDVLMIMAGAGVGVAVKH